MIINSIGLKNFKSYGNNMQKVLFNKGGELILLSGDNEAGKSSLIEAIDFTLYGIVRGKNTKKIALAKLPNRQNKSLETEINFINDDGDNIIIRRKIEPTSLEIFKNTKPFFKEFKGMSTEQREVFIGLEYNTYKSLISLNLSDFANFVNLDTETKRKLLNKLFNIREIDEYFSISKDILKNCYKEKEGLDTMKLSKINTINTYKDNIENIQRQTGTMDKEDIKKEMMSYKITYTDLKHEIEDFSISMTQFHKDLKTKNEILDGKKNRILQENFYLKEINNKIDIFNSGVCPICETVLDANHNKHRLEDLEKDKIIKIGEIDTIKSEYTELYNEIKFISGEKNKLSNEISKKSYDYNIISNKLKDLKRQYDTEDVSINEIRKNIQKLENEVFELDKKLDLILQKIDLYDKIVEYLSEKGIRKSIINTIIEPINENLQFFLKEIESKYNVKLNDEFDAIIKDKFIEDIDPETLSIGGARKINIAIALSYIKTILDVNKRINILFLDEVFSSISPSNINIMLRVLRDFARTNNINIVIVHQINFDTNMFDRVIHIEKKYFSMITDTYKKKEEENDGV